MFYLFYVTWICFVSIGYPAIITLVLSLKNKISLLEWWTLGYWFMIITRVGLSNFEKILITETGAHWSLNGKMFDSFLGGNKIISEYFESTLLLCFYWPIQC